MNITGLHDTDAGGYRARNLRNGSESSDAVTLEQLRAETQYRWLHKTVYDPIVTQYPLMIAERDLKVLSVISAVQFATSGSVSFRMQKTSDLNSGHTDLKTSDTVNSSSTPSTVSYYNHLSEGEALVVDVTNVTPYAELIAFAIKYTFDVVQPAKVLFFYGSDLMVSPQPNVYKAGAVSLGYGVGLSVVGFKPYNAVSFMYGVDLTVAAAKQHRGMAAMEYGVDLSVLAETCKNTVSMSYGATMSVKAAPLAKASMDYAVWFSVRPEPVKSGRASMSYGMDMSVSAAKDGYNKVSMGYGVSLSVKGCASKSAKVSFLASCHLESVHATKS